MSGKTLLFRSCKETFDYLGVGDQKLYKHLASGLPMETEYGVCKVEYDGTEKKQVLPAPKKKSRHHFDYIEPEAELADMRVLATWSDGAQIFFPTLSKAANYFMVSPECMKKIAEEGGTIYSKEMGTVYIEEAL